MSDANTQLRPEARPYLVSVLVPLYNHASTVVRALDSILQSDTSTICLIVCDDASSDRSLEVAQSWIGANGHRFASALVLTNPKNLGITRNLNGLLAYARGEYVTLLASDDELAARAIDVQAAYLQSNQDIDFLFANCGTIDAVSEIVNDRVVSDRRAAWMRRANCAMLDIVFNWSLPWTRLFARRAAFTRLGPYPQRYVFEDRWATLQIARTKRFGYLHTVVHLYRLRPAGLGTAGLDRTQMLKDTFEIEEEALTRTRGWLWFLLRIHTLAHVRTSWWAPMRVVCRAIQLVLILGHRLFTR